MSKCAKLGSLIDIRTGYLSRSGIREAPSGGYCLLQMSDFNGTRTALHTDTLTRFQPGEMRSDQTIQPDEVVFLAKGVNNFAFHPGPLPAPTLAASYFYVLTPSPELRPAYLAWFLNHPDTRRVFDRIAGVGSRMPVIKKSDLADIDVPLPSISAQDKIVELHALLLREATLLDQLKHARKTFMDTLTMAIATGEERETTHHV